MTDALSPAGDRWQLRFERRLAHPPEKVWRAITEAQHLNRWYPFTAAAIDLRVGGRILFRDEEGTELHAEITELVPPKAFAFTEHDEETGVHELRLELEPDAEGCRLIFTHTFADDTWAAQTETGWQHCLDALTRAVEQVG
ncbi:SRPBCC domain-containing protein [Saccharopolyspora griseoalba]|uniref:SRPBCC domain-containing protein n=1 Tax=Saccharopolyspora griseoalba TaxID=1431848 RepID=A0ABW2LQ14_9PSEU